MLSNVVGLSFLSKVWKILLFSVSEGEWGCVIAVFLAHFPERGIPDYIARTVSFYGCLPWKLASSVSPR